MKPTGEWALTAIMMRRQGATLAAVAKVVGTSPSRVRQVVLHNDFKAQRRMRAPWEREWHQAVKETGERSGGRPLHEGGYGTHEESIDHTFAVLVARGVAVEVVRETLGLPAGMPPCDCFSRAS